MTRGMPRHKYDRKVARYIEQGRLSRLRDYVKKHDIDLKGLHVGEERNSPVHLACNHGHEHILRWLLKEGVDVQKANSLGQLPLHVACLFAINHDKDAYTSLVLPVLKAWTVALDVPDNSGATPRQLLSRIKADLMKKGFAEDSSSSSSSSSDEDPEEDSESDDWQKRLAAEATEEFSEFNGKFSQDDLEDEAETYDQWANRLYHEHRNKKYAHVYAQAERMRKQQQQKEKERHEFQKKLEKEHEEYQRRAKKRREDQQKQKLSLDKQLYNHRSNEIFNNTKESRKSLTFDKIPWPYSKRGGISTLKDFLLSDLDPKDTGKCKKYIRDQQVRWHPDKFLQRVGNRLNPDDKEKVLNHVKEISQELNNLAGQLEDS